MSVRIDQIRPQDYGVIIELNRAMMPNLPLSHRSLAAFLDYADVHVAAWIDERLVGFMYALRPGMAYSCPHYHWFSERYRDFSYVDRIMVLPNYRRRGAGRAMYATTEDTLRSKNLKLTLEIASNPLDEVLMDFHRAMGFQKVGLRAGATREFAMMAKQLS